MLFNARELLVFLFTTRPKYSLGHNQASLWGEIMAGAGIAGGRFLQTHRAHRVLRKQQIYTYVQIFGYTVSAQNINKKPLILSPQDETKDEIMKE
jgi:hypothetical protein